VSDFVDADWKEAESLIKQIEVIGHKGNEPVSISMNLVGLSCIGIGTDAAVFHYDKTPNYAFKVYSEQSLSKKDIEQSVYQRLKGAEYFPQFYGSGQNFIVLSYEKGVTLYDCLLRGLSIPRQVMNDVAEAREYVRSLDLNPRDIHLKNVILQDGKGKVIDVSEYVKEGSDNRWEHLAWAYDNIYPMVDGVKVPSWTLETVKNWYYRVDTATFALEEFAQQAIQVFFKNRG
jgi:predicted Ser/Thr protein kinase